MASLKLIFVGLIAVAGSGTCLTLRQNTTDARSKIEGGEPMCIDKAPYQVYLKEGENYFCGGALIRLNIVLTAAHCVEDIMNSVSELSIVAGTDSTNLSRDDGRIEILSQYIEMHPKYEPESEEGSLEYDFAIIKLAKEFPLTKKIIPISLPTHNVKENEELLLTGIGLVDKNGKQPSPCLKAYKPKVISCKKSAPNFKINNYNAIICHKNDLGYRSRSGDSGSPMVNAEGKLAGIHTGTTSQSTCQLGINVYYYLNWIHKIMIQYVDLP